MLDHLSIDSHVQQLISAYNAVSCHEPLTITDTSIADFSNLWHLCQSLRNKEIAHAVCSDERLNDIKPKLLMLYAEWCYLREIQAARNIFESQDAQSAFRTLFTDLPLYERIVALEYQAVRICAGRDLKNALMIGSGPVGSTAMILQGLGLNVDCVDISAEATEISRELMRCLSIAAGMCHITSDILELRDLSKYDVIWLAGFVGVAGMKQKVIEHLSMHAAPGAFLIVRSASTPCNILYTEVQPWELDSFERYIYLQPLSFNNHSSYIVRQYNEHTAHG
ncbi:hypothetical protein XACN24_12050 [Xanthomonas albilineans]|uniref:Putative nicotinamide synthase protein n=1 Tax=Xanthomonas albilineans (strain GPE PC73 / CFBP 7063) TaxID=380358 RepID=D2U9J7_XANAP|nr:nicotianamine synthase family protein [Xanthomonas albilineans]CBA16949.1 putative nicotinamide synthase protein [Xanthomonas albilineans GPE PC73]